MLNNATIDKLITMKLKVMADAYIVQEQEPSYRGIEFPTVWPCWSMLNTTSVRITA